MNIKLKQHIALIPTLLTLSLTMPVIAWYAVGYQGDDVAGWFQRSGSLVVLCSGIMEYVLFKITLASTPVTGQHKHEKRPRRLAVSAKYLQFVESLKYLIAAVAIAGTVIWGYGDLIYLAFN